MAIKANTPKLSEALRNSPDVGEDGRLDVEYYPVPEIESNDAYLREVWEEAVRMVNEGGLAPEE